MFIPVHVASPVKENKGPREEGRTKKRRVKKKKKKRKDTQLNKGQTSYSCFSVPERKDGGGGR